MKGDILLLTTYFLAKESDLKDFHIQYLKRVEKAREITDIIFVSDWIRGEHDDSMRDLLMLDFRRDMQALGKFPFDDDGGGR